MPSEHIPGLPAFEDDLEMWSSSPLQAFDHFLANHLQDGRPLRPSSYRIYRGMFERMLTWLLAQHKGVLDLDAPLLEAFLDCRPLGERSRHRYLLTFTALYRRIAHLKQDFHNPALRVMATEPEFERPPPEVLSPLEVRAILSSLGGARTWKHRRDRAIVLSILGAGLRTRELLAMTTDWLIITPGKGVTQISVPAINPMSARIAVVLPFAEAPLYEWKQERERLRIPGALLMPASASTGEPLVASTLFRQVKKRLVSLGIHRRYEGPMLLRNTYGAMSIRFYGIEAARASLGHESLRATEIIEASAPFWRTKDFKFQLENENILA